MKQVLHIIKSLDKFDYLAVIIPALILLPTITFPISNDLSIFFLGGKSLLNGGQIYKDFIDFKPPFIFYITAFSIKLFGESEISLRVFDFIIQISASVCLFVIIKNYINKNAALYSSIIYSALYTSLHYTQTMNPECYAALPILTILSIELKEKPRIISHIITGICVAILFALKYTMGIVLVGMLLYDIFSGNAFNIKFLKKYLLIGLSFTAFSVLFFIQLFNSETWDAFKDVVSYLSFYGSKPEMSISTISDMLKNTGYYFGDRFSLFISLLTFTGIFFSIRPISKKTDKISIITAIFFLLLLLSVFIEKKMAVYHFSRIYLPAAILAGFALNEIIKSISIKAFKTNLIAVLITLSLIIFFAIMSPLPRMLNIIKVPYYFAVDNDKYNALFQDEGSSSKLRNDQIEAAEYIKKAAEKNDKVFIMTTGSSYINYLLRDYEQPAFLHSQPYISEFVPENWKIRFLDYFSNSDYLVIQLNDRHPLLFMHEMSTFEFIQNNDEYTEILNSKYELINQSKYYNIYKRK